MASNEVSGNNSEDQCPTVTPSESYIYHVPDDLLQTVFQHLSATDLCHVASCCRWLRDATNQDSLWRPLCQSRGWEHYGTTTNLAKTASYRPSEQAVDDSTAGDDIVTFQEDRIVTGDNTAGLTSTCKWKGVYMRADHLDSNWVTKRSHGNNIDLVKLPDFRQAAFVDGDLLAVAVSNYSIYVYDIRKGILRCLVNVLERHRSYKIKDGVMVVAYRHKLRTFDSKSGQQLKVIDGCHHNRRLPLLFDGELILTCPKANRHNDICVWDIQGVKQRILTDVTKNHDPISNWDYRDKMVVAAYTNTNILVWDVRSGERLHKLSCGKVPLLKLVDNVIVCVSLSNDYDRSWLVNSWNKDTGECQHTISFFSSARNTLLPVFINCMIVAEEDTVPGTIRHVGEALFYLNGKLVREMGDLINTRQMFMYEDVYTRGVHGSKYPFRKININTDRFSRAFSEPFALFEFIKPRIFYATPNGLVPLFDLDETFNTASVLYMDDIRMILVDRATRRLLIHHFW